jgi:multiple antibiotic resistance protein
MNLWYLIACKARISDFSMFQHIIQDAVTLFVIIDPIALVPVFIAITYRQDPHERQKIALRAVLISAVVLGGFLIFGQFLLTALDVSLSAFQIGGGLVFKLGQPVGAAAKPATRVN